VVLASGPPFHSFVAGYYLAQAYRCRLVLDYRDEWTECPFDFVEADGSDRFWEKRCLRAADLVVFVTQSQLEHHLRAFPFVPRARCVVIPNGWDHEAGDGDRPMPIASPTSPVTLSFVGGLGSFAEPGVFLSAVEDVLRRRPDLAQTLRFRFIGKKDLGAADELGRFAFPEALDLVDHVPVPDAISAMGWTSGCRRAAALRWPSATSTNSGTLPPTEGAEPTSPVVPNTCGRPIRAEKRGRNATGRGMTRR